MSSQMELDMGDSKTKLAETENILQFFAYYHLPVHLQEISKPFCELAWKLVEILPRNPERTVSLRKLLEAKDCAVRAHISQNQKS